MSDAGEAFREKLRRIRHQADLGNLIEAAGKLGVSRGSLGGYERGERLPDIDFLARLAALTGADLHELVRLRLAAAGHEVADGLPAAEQSGQYRPAGRNAGAVRDLLTAAGDRVPMRWSLLIMELAARGDLTADGAQAVIEFLSGSGSGSTDKSPEAGTEEISSAR